MLIRMELNKKTHVNTYAAFDIRTVFLLLDVFYRTFQSFKIVLANTSNDFHIFDSFSV